MKSSNSHVSGAPTFRSPSRTTRLVLLGAILLFAFAMRFWHIAEVPAGIYPDEAQNGYDAYLAQHTGVYQWFYPDNNGREGLYINLIALSFKLFGVHVWSFKLPGVLIGTLTVLGVYLLAREVFWRWRSGVYLALISALLVAGSFWHVMFSRIGFRAILLPFVLTFAFWLMLRGLRRLKSSKSALWTFAFSGAVFGLGLHTYIAFRIAPAALIVLFVALLVARRFRFRALWRPALAFLAGTLITAAPMLWTFSTHPEYFSSRSGSVSIFTPENNGGDLLGTLGKTLTLSLGMFNFYGDQNWRHGYPPYATLEPVTGIFFLIGLFTSIIITVRFFGALAWHTLQRLARVPQHMLRTTRPTWPSVHLFLLAWFVLMLAPEFLTNEGLPHALRAIGVLPVVYLFAAMGIGVLWRTFEHHHLLFREFFVPLLGVLLLYIATFGVIKYHVFWAQRPEVAGAFNKNLTDIAHAAQAAPADTEKVVLAGPLERLPVKLLTTQVPHMTFLYEHEIPTYAPTQKDIIVYMTDCPAHITQAFRARLGTVRVIEHSAPLGSHYCTLTPAD